MTDVTLTIYEAKICERFKELIIFKLSFRQTLTKKPVAPGNFLLPGAMIINSLRPSDAYMRQ